MAYLNSKENEERYNALKAKYQGEATRRRIKIKLAEAKVDAWGETLKAIQHEWQEWNKTKFVGTFTNEKKAQQIDIQSRMDKARAKIEKAKLELSRLHAELNGVSFNN
jgi:hypothetical protein